MDTACLGPDKPTVVPTPFRGLRILLVDKDTSSLLSIASVLEEQSYKVTTTELESKALSILQERAEQFDLVVADVNMTETDCLKFTESIKLLRDLPIILMSSTAKREMVKVAMSKGACFFFKKPVSKEQLKNVWQHVYRKRRHQIMEAENVKNKNNEEQENDSRGYEDEEVDSTPRIACENDLLDPNNEHAGLEEQIKNDGTNSDEIKNDETSAYGSKRSISAENDEPERSKRRRIVIDECREVRVEHSDSEQSSSRDSRAITGDERKRKDENHDNATLEKKSRLCWTPDLQLKFKEAISVLGEEEARPKRVLEIMNVPNLTQRQVASHLQKYRVRAQRCEHSGATPSLVQSRISTSRGRNESTQTPYSQGPKTSNSRLGVHLEKSNPVSVSHPRRIVGSATANFGTLDHQSKYGESSTNLSKKHQLYNHSRNYGATKLLSHNTIIRAPNYGGILESSSQDLRSYHASSDFESVQAAFNRMVHPNCNNHDETQAVLSRESNWSREKGNLPIDVIQKQQGKGKQHINVEQSAGYFSSVTQKLPFPMTSGHNHESITVPSELQQQLDLSPDVDDYYACQNPNQFHMSFTELLQKTNIRKGLFPFEGSSHPNKLTTEFNNVMHELPGLASPSYNINQRQTLPKNDNVMKFSKRAQELQDNHQ